MSQEIRKYPETWKRAVDIASNHYTNCDYNKPFKPCPICAKIMKLEMQTISIVQILGKEMEL